MSFSYFAFRRQAEPVPAPMTLQRSCACEATGGSCERCSASRTAIQRDRLGTSAPPMDFSSVGPVVAAAGEPLPAATLGRMERSFGRDFSSVRIHSDHEARASALALDARAYTAGQHIVLGPRAPSLSSTAGQQLLGHELAHVIQQSHGGVGEGIDPEPRLEAEAHRAGDAVAAGRPAKLGGAPATGIQREEETEVDPDQFLWDLGYREGDYAYVSSQTTYDDVPVSEKEFSYYQGMDASKAEMARGETDRVRDDIESVKLAQDIYKTAQKNRFGATPMAIDGRIEMVKGLGSDAEGETIGNEVIIMHDVATEAEVTRRAGTSAPMTFEIFARQYEKQKGTLVGAEQAFFQYREHESDELYKGYRIIDASNAAANFIAKSTVGMITSGFNPVATFLPDIAGTGAKYTAKGLGASDEVADLADNFTGMVVGMGNPTKMTVPQALAPALGMGAQYFAERRGASADDAGILNDLVQLTVGHFGHGGGKEPRPGDVLREKLGTGAQRPGFVEHPTAPTLKPTAREEIPANRPKAAQQPPAAEPVVPKAAPHAAAPKPPHETARAPAEPKAGKAGTHSEKDSHKPLAPPEPVGGDHHTQVTPSGIEMCSPTPCPNLRVVYKPELAKDPALAKEMSRLEALRKIAARQDAAGKPDPAFAKRISDEAAALQKKLEAVRQGKAPKTQPVPQRPANAAAPFKPPRPGAPEHSFEGVIDPAAESARPRNKKLLERAGKHDIGGYHDLTGSGKYGRRGDKLDSDEALQNLFIRLKKAVSRTSKATKDNPAMALDPKTHRQIKNLKAPQMKGKSARQALDYHLQQMKKLVPDFALHELRKEAEKFIKKSKL